MGDARTRPGTAAANHRAVSPIRAGQRNHRLTSLEIPLRTRFPLSPAIKPAHHLASLHSSHHQSPPPLLVAKRFLIADPIAGSLALHHSTRNAFSFLLLRRRLPCFLRQQQQQAAAMADGGECGGRACLVSELGRVQGLVRQLELHLHAPSDAASVELCRRLIHQIVALTDRSIGMARSPDLALTAAHFLPAAAQPPSGAPSPLSDAGSDHHQQQPFRASPKKRKATARWTSQQVRVSAAGGGAADGPADDGHSWRKYGQKDILGAKHPRAYYRCTHRNSQNCPATKQVQRTDGDPTLFDVVYHGDHTCRPSASGGGGAAGRRHSQHNPHAESALQGLAARLTVATAATDGGAAALPPMTPDSCPARGASSPWSLASPVGSDSNAGVSPACPVPAGYGDWVSDGDLQEVVSGFAAVSRLPAALDSEFLPLECFAFDQGFDMDGAMPSLFYP